MRVVIATCSVDYEGRLNAHLPLAARLLMVKADGSVLVHSDGGSYKPLNWMAPPCSMAEVEPDETEATEGVEAVWVVQHAKTEDRLRVKLHEVHHDSAHDLGVDPGLVKDGVEAHLQKLLAEHIETLGEGYTLVRREYPTAIGPIDLDLPAGELGATFSGGLKFNGIRSNDTRSSLGRHVRHLRCRYIGDNVGLGGGGEDCGRDRRERPARHRSRRRCRW